MFHAAVGAVNGKQRARARLLRGKSVNRLVGMLRARMCFFGDFGSGGRIGGRKIISYYR